MRPPAQLPPDESRSLALNVVAWSGYAISFTFVVVRLFTRIRISRSAGWDDGVIVFSSVRFPPATE